MESVKVMLRNSLISACLLLSLALPAQADWTVHKNSDLAKTGAYGWSVKLPDHWMQLPDVRPAWPQGVGYAAPGGNTYIIITKSPKPTDAEQAQLQKRGFTKSQREVKAYHMLEFTKSSGSDTERLLYMTTPRGEYRINMRYLSDGEQEMEKILKSFTFINDPNAKPASAWPNFYGPEQAFNISYPSDCQASQDATGFTITRGGKTLMQGKLYENSDPPAQSFRGMARQLSMHFRPNGIEPAKFSPYEIGSITAYEVMGQQQDKNLYGPLLYVPIRHSKWKVLECYLVDQKEANDYFRIINTIKLP